MRKALIVMLIAHAAVTVATLDASSVWNVFPPFRERFIYQMLSDIACASGIVFLLCYVQLRKRGRPLKGLFVTMACTALVGSFAPLVYLLVEKDLFEIK